MLWPHQNCLDQWCRHGIANCTHTQATTRHDALRTWIDMHSISIVAIRIQPKRFFYRKHTKRSHYTLLNKTNLRRCNVEIKVKKSSISVVGHGRVLANGLYDQWVIFLPFIVLSWLGSVHTEGNLALKLMLAGRVLSYCWLDKASIIRVGLNEGYMAGLLGCTV